MNDLDVCNPPDVLDAILRDTKALKFEMASEVRTGSLLRVLAAAKPAGNLLELGTGTGVGTAWLLAGMDTDSRLDSVDSDPLLQDVARKHLGKDGRIVFHLTEGGRFLEQSAPEHYDLIYADTWPGKFTNLDEALRLLRRGGIYIIDDLLPQPTWPEGHADKIPPLIAELEGRSGFFSTKLAWASGLLVLVRSHAS